MMWWRRCPHAEVAVTAAWDAQTALVACQRCSWAVVAPLPPIRRLPTACMDSGSAVLVDSAAVEELQLRNVVDQATRGVDLTTGGGS